MCGGTWQAHFANCVGCQGVIDKATLIDYPVRGMPTYLLRDVDAELWEKVKARAATEGRNMRWVLLRLLESYVERGVPKVKR
jgi:hypothetical protein